MQLQNAKIVMMAILASRLMGDMTKNCFYLSQDKYHHCHDLRIFMAVLCPFFCAVAKFKDCDSGDTFHWLLGR
jgi:hypothetical protein